DGVSGQSTPPPMDPPRPGDLVEVEVTGAAPHHLTSDAPLLSLRQTGAGDAWAERAGRVGPVAVGLGMPTVSPPG
ncbi:MAG: hypothetical protein M3353_06310, partial [Actinomycetota bacterium]|nr:hypothetical protein [Actinomycetota bacterium]